MIPSVQECAANAIDSISLALSGEQILYSNSLGRITTDCLVLRNGDGRSTAIFSHRATSGIRTLKQSHLALLAIAFGFFFIAAAALWSKDGNGAGIPAVFLGLLFLLGYWGTQSACVVVSIGSERIQSIHGSVAEAVGLITRLELMDTAVDARAASACRRPGQIMSLATKHGTDPAVLV